MLRMPRIVATGGTWYILQSRLKDSVIVQIYVAKQSLIECELSRIECEQSFDYERSLTELRR